MTEEEVYLGTKRYLIKNNFLVLAGQPPRGVDHLPVIEIKESNSEKGSRFSYKPDLIAFKNNRFIIIECKPTFNYGDYQKLHNILSNSTRFKNFYLELEQYNILFKANYTLGFEYFCQNIQIALAYCGEINDKYNDIDYICVSNWNGDGFSTIQ